MSAGIKATAIFETRMIDFEEAAIITGSTTHDATRVLHNGKQYKIERTYSKDGETIELTCSDLVV